MSEDGLGALFLLYFVAVVPASIGAFARGDTGLALLILFGCLLLTSVLAFVVAGVGALTRV